MRSQWLVVVAVLGGLLLAPWVAWVCLVVTVPFTYNTPTSSLPLAFTLFTLLTVPVAVLVALKGTTAVQRGFATGVLIGWLVLGIWIGIGAAEAV
jgi:hypothetical protein